MGTAEHDKGKIRFVSLSLRWLTGVFLLGLVLIFGLRAFFTNLEAELRAQGANERARLFVGEEIVLGIQGLEKDLYRIATSQNLAGFLRVKKSVDARLDKLTHDLLVLKEGGTSIRTIRLNIENLDETTREMTYRPDARDTRYVMELIEILPHLDSVRAKVGELELLLAERWQAIDNPDRRQYFSSEEKIATLLKQVPPFFERLDENANRLFVEGDHRLRALEAELQERRDGLKRLETNLIVVVIVLGGIAGTLYLRRLSDALDRAQQARDEVESKRAEIATMLDTLSDGVYATDLEGRITFINESAVVILGFQARDLIGQNAHESFHHKRPDGKEFPQAQCPLIAVMRDGVSLQGEEHFVRSNGRFIPVSYRSNPLRHSGHVVGSLVSFQDIGSQQEAQARIRLQQAGLDAAANMIVITDRDGHMEYVNPAFCKTTGYAASEVIGKKTSLLSSGFHDAAFYRDMWSTLQVGDTWEGELSNRRKNGEIYQEQMTITPIMENGRITHFVAIKRDITEEASTRTRLKLLEAAIQESDQAIFITDTDAGDLGPTIRYVNPAFSRITGFSAEEAIGWPTGILRGPDTDQKKIELLKNAIAGGESFVLEMNYRRKDGSSYMAELHYAPVPDESGKVAHFIATLTDISQRREFETALRQARDQALETARIKSEFLSTMSHEIRTPMNGIIGMSDLLLDTRLSKEQSELVVILRDSANSLLTIINDILDFSKIEAGKLEIENTAYSLTGIVEGTAELLDAKAREQGTSLMCFVDPTLPGSLIGDPARVRQVLLNLVGNAVKFTQRGEIEIVVSRAMETDVPRLRFEIRDSGIGISSEAQGRLFQSFTQADSSTTRKYGGTGLGLAICKRLVGMMGGDIGVVSQEGMGSTFWFTLPLVGADSTTTQVSIDSAAVATSRGGRVLLAESHAFSRDALLSYLTSWGMQCDVAENARQAIDFACAAVSSGNPHAAAIIELSLPDTGGIELGRLLREDARLENMRLILLTTYDQRNQFATARESGFASCLVKPVRQAHLLDSLAAQAPLQVEPEEISLAAKADTPEIDLLDALDSQRLILLAEDNPTNQRVAQLQINKLGYAVHIVSNGQEAVDAAEALPYAVILMDCQMPIADGFEATAMIRRQERASGRHIPIIAMTANAMEGDRERCIAAGMDDYVSKPIKSEILAETLARWIRPAGIQVGADKAPVAKSAPIDVGHLMAFLGDDRDMIKELLEVFRVSTVSLLEKIHTAITLEDKDKIKALAHEAKGACGNLGIEEMSRIAARLEKAAASSDWVAIAALGPDLERAFADIQGQLRDPFTETRQ